MSLRHLNHHRKALCLLTNSTNVVYSLFSIWKLKHKPQKEQFSDIILKQKSDHYFFIRASVYNDMLMGGRSLLTTLGLLLTKQILFTRRTLVFKIIPSKSLIIPLFDFLLVTSSHLIFEADVTDFLLWHRLRHSLFTVIVPSFCRLAHMKTNFQKRIVKLLSDIFDLHSL